MSDSDSDHEGHRSHQKKQFKQTGLGEIQFTTENNNMFSYQPRTQNSDSSENQEDQKQSGQTIQQNNISITDKQEEQIIVDPHSGQNNKTELVENVSQVKVETIQDVIQKSIPSKIQQQYIEESKEITTKQDKTYIQQKEFQQNESIIQKQKNPFTQKQNKPSTEKQTEPIIEKQNDPIIEKQEKSEICQIKSQPQGEVAIQIPKMEGIIQRIEKAKNHDDDDNNNNLKKEGIVQDVVPYKNQDKILKNNIQIIQKKICEKQVDLELEADLALLKKNFSQKDKKKQSITIHPKAVKQSDKHKANKTMFTSQKNRLTQPILSTNEDTKTQEAKMISRMIHEKKKQNYNLLKKWDKRRQDSLALHRSSIQILQTEVDKRIKCSIQNLDIYTNFFKQKAKQEEKYAGHPIINTRYVLQNNSLSKNVYINCSVILNSLSDQNNIRCRKINDFIHLIQNDILRNLIIDHLNQSQRQLLRIREKITTLRSSLRKYNTQTQQKANELALFFNQNIVTSSDKDFFFTQIQFLRKSSQQTMVQKKLGDYCLEYYHAAINEQIKRSQVIRQAVITFIKGLKECYNIDTDPAEIEQLSKAQQDKLIEQFYSLEEMLDERSLSLFRDHQNLSDDQELTTDHFANYLKSFDFEPYDSRIILLKQFSIRHKLTSSKEIALKSSINSEQESCYLVITVDKHIHMFMNKEKTDPYCRPDISLLLGSKNLQFKPSLKFPDILDIVVKEQKRNSMISYFWQTKNDKIYRLKFPSKDTREEFIDYATKKALF